MTKKNERIMCIAGFVVSLLFIGNATAMVQDEPPDPSPKSRYVPGFNIEILMSEEGREHVLEYEVPHLDLNLEEFPCAEDLAQTFAAKKSASAIYQATDRETYSVQTTMNWFRYRVYESHYWFDHRMTVSYKFAQEKGMILQNVKLELTEKESSDDENPSSSGKIVAYYIQIFSFNNQEEQTCEATFSELFDNYIEKVNEYMVESDVASEYSLRLEKIEKEIENQRHIQKLKKGGYIKPSDSLHFFELFPSTYEAF